MTPWLYVAIVAYAALNLGALFAIPILITLRWVPANSWIKILAAHLTVWTLLMGVIAWYQERPFPLWAAVAAVTAGAIAIRAGKGKLNQNAMISALADLWAIILGYIAHAAFVGFEWS